LGSFASLPINGKIIRSNPMTKEDLYAISYKWFSGLRRQEDAGVHDGELFFGYSAGNGNVTKEFMDVLEQESGEILDEAKRIFLDAKKIHGFFEENTLPRVSKYLGISFDEAVKKRLAVDDDHRRLCQKFACEAVDVFPGEIEAYADRRGRSSKSEVLLRLTASGSY
jgi:hypothetical protein